MVLWSNLPDKNSSSSTVRFLSNLESFDIPTNTKLNIEQQKIKDFYLENEHVFCYLKDEWYIWNKPTNSYKMETKWIIFLENWTNCRKRIEYIIEDYPSILWWLIGWIIWSVITFIFTR